MHLGAASILHAPALPPGFQPRSCEGDPWGAALIGAADGVEPATVFWSGVAGHCRGAVVLAPERALQTEVLLELGLLAVFDALAVVGPPQVPVHLRRPDGVVVDGGRAATVQAAQGLGWAVLGFDVALHADRAAPGETPEVTSLSEEGFGDVTAAELLGHVCRHLLGWIDVLLDGGAGPLSRAVDQRLARAVAA